MLSGSAGIAALAALALLACGGEAPQGRPEMTASTPLRRVIPLARAADGGTPEPVVDRELLDVALDRGQSWQLELVLRTPGRHTVVLRYVGEEPRLLSGPPGGGTLTPLRRVSSAPGRLEATLRAPTTRLRLVLRSLAGPTRPTHLRVQRWATTPVAAGSSASARSEPPAPAPASPRDRRPSSAPSSLAAGLAAPRRREVGLESRPAWILAPGSRLDLPLELPAQATRLALAVAPAGRGRLPSSTAGLTVSWLDEEGRRPLTRVAPSLTSFRWHELLLELGSLAGRRGRLLLQAEDTAAPGGTAAQGAAAKSTAPGGAAAGSAGQNGDPAAQAGWLVAVPEVLCERGRRRPNLVLISLDTTRPDHLGVYGYERDTTPRLDALAAGAVVFERATSVSAYTLPAHATVFTGMHPLGHGVVHPGQALDTAALPLLARLLRDRGWATRAFTGGGYLSADYGFAAGFSSYGQHDPLNGLTAKGRDLLARGARGPALLEAVEAQNWNAALRWIEERRELPFFIFLQTFAIHDYRPGDRQRGRFGGPQPGQGVQPLRRLEEQLVQPYTVAERRQLVDLYDEAIAEVDEQLGRLFALLARLSLAEDTIVVVLADHGETLGEHGWGGVDLVGHNLGLWEELVAVPLILAAPGLAPARRSERVSLLDVAPTLLELLGLPIPAAVQGRSWVGWLRGRSGAAPPSPVLLDLASNTARQRALYAGRFKLVSGDSRALVTLPVAREQVLYDLRADPGEQHDVAAGHDAELARLQGRLADLVAAFSASGRAPAQAELDAQTRLRLRQLGYLQR